MRLARHWVVPVLLYVVVDFLDPSIPGVFFLDSEQLFLDGVIDHGKTFRAPRAHHDEQPAVVIAATPDVSDTATIEVRHVEVVPSAHRWHRRHVDHRAAPPESPEDH